MKNKLEKFLTWCAATGHARTNMYQARAALHKEYSFDDWLKQGDATRQDCISCAGAVLSLTGRPCGEEWRYYRHCKFYKENTFCGVADGGCESREKNLKHADAIARWEAARKHRRSSFKALFHFKWFDLLREYRQLKAEVELMDANSIQKYHAWQEGHVPYTDFQQADALFKETVLKRDAARAKLFRRNK